MDYTRTMDDEEFILFFRQIGIADVGKVGGKNASLGELFNQLGPQGILVPDGFALTAAAFRLFLQRNGLEIRLQELMSSLDKKDFTNLAVMGASARSLILNGELPEEIKAAVSQAYMALSDNAGLPSLAVAVRSSATAEDLPAASFAGRMESFLNINGERQLLDAVQRCYASLFTDRAMKYRCEMGFDSTEISISVGVQYMVRSDIGSAGVAFTIDPDTGFSNAIIINGSWGLGENIVQGKVTPDEWCVFKPTLNDPQLDPVLKAQCGRKEYTMVYAENTLQSDAGRTILNIETPVEKQRAFSLSKSEVIQLAKWCALIESHYGRPMDIEWARDGLTQSMYIVQARPETVHAKKQKSVREIYQLSGEGKVLAKGIALGDKITAGRARIISSPLAGDQLQDGEILVTDSTNPDWDTVLKKAGGIITNKGGRTSHAAIVAREMGTVAVVGCGHATENIQSGQLITVSCAQGKEGRVFEGYLPWTVHEQDYSQLPVTATEPMLILADPERAFELCRYPGRGVGLMRLEFVISNSIRIHPLALVDPEKVLDENTRGAIGEMISGYTDGKSYFVDKLASAVSMVAAAFYPREVIVRMSDFKSNEYANLIGGNYFEPKEENPMIGWRGASRYYSDFYRKGFSLECAAMKKVRSEMGLTNVKLMIPFCRTPEEADKVLAEMASNGLCRGERDLEIYVMVEIPSNVLLADEFARRFDGFSIGSNDLTQLTLGLDRDSSLVSSLFDEENPAVKALISETIRAAKRNNIHVGLCGQAPSDIPAFARFLVLEGIHSISFNPDALLKGIENIGNSELELTAAKTEKSAAV